MARPSKWIELDMPKKLDAVTGWAKNGSTNEEIAKMLGISMAVFYDWRNKFPEFKESLKKGKDIANGELLNSAFTQSVGFKYTEQQGFKVKDWQYFPGQEEGEEGKWLQVERVVIIEVERFCPPNPTMSIFMLKNRLPDQYKDKREHDVNANMVFSITPAPSPGDDAG